jgi:hypothetical protein
METNKFIEEIKDYYLQSNDFNGFPFGDIKKKYKIETGDLRKILLPLISEEKVSLVFSDNPHTKQFDIDIDKQIQVLEGDEVENACIYPAKKYLSQMVDRKVYENCPYTKELAFGAAQLEFRAFDLTILEPYINDPRYIYQNNSIGGSIGISDKYYLDEITQLPEQDKVSLQTFGFCHDQTGKRAVAVLLRYLKNLTPKHQIIWKSKELNSSWKLHPDYDRSVKGVWEMGGISIFDAILEELKLINKMCKAMNKPSLFKKDFNEDRPNEFSFLIRSTTKEFNNFIHTLDKMISENIDEAFFKDDIKNGDIEEKNEHGGRKSSITLLESWLKRFYKIENQDLHRELLSPFAEIRKKRNKPAHSIVQNEFNPNFIDEQKDLLTKTYNVLNMLREIFNRHPKCKNINFNINRYLVERKIWIQ